MADLRISELPKLLGKDLEANDDLAVADYSASETRRLTTKDLVQNGVNLIDDGSIPGVKLVADSVTAREIGPDAVTDSELADDAVDTAAIKDLAVVNGKVALATLTGDRIVADTLTAREIGPNAITASELADNAVDTAAIQALAVTDAKIASGIDGAKLTDGTVVDAKIVDLDGAKLFADSVTAAQIAADAITDSELADDAVDTAAIKDLAVVNAKVALATLTGDRLVADTLTAREIGPDAITDSELADNAVDTAAIKDLAVTDAKIAPGIDGAKLTDGTVVDAKIVGLDGAKLVADSVTAAQIAPDAVTDSELADNAVDTAAIQDLAVVNAKVALATLTGDRIVADTLTAREIAPDAITDSELADDAVDTGAIQDTAVTDTKIAPGVDGAKLTDGTVVDSKITGLNGAKLTDGTVVDSKIVNLDGAKLTDGTVVDAKIVGLDGAKLTDGTVVDAKIVGLDGAKLTDSTVVDAKIVDLDGAKLFANSVTAAQIAPDAITASELADNAVDNAAIQDASVTDSKLIAGINGAKLTNSTVTADKITSSSFDRGLDKTSGAIGHTNAVTPQTMNGITFDDQGHVTAAAPLANADLPPATIAAIGGVSVPADSGLTVTGTGVLDHENNVTAGSISGIDWDDHGHISSTRALIGTDLPAASAINLGAVSVPGPTLRITGLGEIKHGDATVAPGDYPKVTVDQQGHVTQGMGLAQADVPALDATILTTGTLDPSRFATKSITREKLADNSIAYIQESQPDTNAVHHEGCLWYQESSAQLRMWNGNSWMPVGFGRLSEENLRFSGTFDATAGSVLDVTTFGTAAGLKSATPIPPATDALTGVYLVCKTTGTYGGDTYDNGDWLLCLGAAGGWVRVDTLSSGAGSTIKIEDLLNVEVTAPNSGDTLIFDAISKKWVNKSTSAKKSAFVEAFDGTRTSFLLTDDATSASSLLISIGGIIQEPGIDFSFAGPRGVAFASAPPAGIEHWVVIEGVISSGGGGGGGTTLPPGTADEEFLGWKATTSTWLPQNTLNGGTY